MVYVSITGLRLRSPFGVARFWWHAIRSMAQARSAEGNLSADTIKHGDVYHTLSLWRDRPAMLAYLRNGSHLKAMQAFDGLATGFAFGFDSDSPPTLSATPHLWLEEERRRLEAGRELSMALA